jgi:hypothetical protein
MLSRIQLFEFALDQCDKLMIKSPNKQSLQSIHQQLEYLLAVASSKQDPSRLSEIIIGVLTAREIEPLDAEAAETFYKVAAEARLMQNE